VLFQSRALSITEILTMDTCRAQPFVLLMGPNLTFLLIVPPSTHLDPTEISWSPRLSYPSMKSPHLLSAPLPLSVNRPIILFYVSLKPFLSLHPRIFFPAGPPALSQIPQTSVCGYGSSLAYVVFLDLVVLQSLLFPCPFDTRAPLYWAFFPNCGADT